MYSSIAMNKIAMNFVYLNINKFHLALSMVKCTLTAKLKWLQTFTFLKESTP